MDSEPNSGRMHWSGGYILFCPFVPSFETVLVLILSYFIQSSLPHFHFHSQAFNFNPAFLTKKP